MAALIGGTGIVNAATADEPHYHQGKLTPYAIGPPSVMLTADDEDKLESGKALMQAIVGGDGATRRMVMVRNIPVPAAIVMDRIMDIENYETMVKGVDRVKAYSDIEEDGVRTLKCSYEIHALHMHFKYWMSHIYDPEQQCMIFRLDYSRKSDIDDSVGYWFVEPRGPVDCRVYYSCDTKMRGWVPAPIYVLLTKTALKQATVWVFDESMEEWKRVQRKQGSSAARTWAKVRDFKRNLRRGREQYMDRLKQPRDRVQRWLDQQKSAQKAAAVPRSLERAPAAEASRHPRRGAVEMEYLLKAAPPALPPQLAPLQRARHALLAGRHRLAAASKLQLQATPKLQLQALWP